MLRPRLPLTSWFRWRLALVLIWVCPGVEGCGGSGSRVVDSGPPSADSSPGPADAGPSPDGGCRCWGEVPEGPLEVACGEAACVGGTGYRCTGPDRAETDPSACSRDDASAAEPEEDPADGPPCRPRTCAEARRACGAIDDGCGGTIDCGSCAGGASCYSNVEEAFCHRPIRGATVLWEATGIFEDVYSEQGSAAAWAPDGEQLVVAGGRLGHLAGEDWFFVDNGVMIVLDASTGGVLGEPFERAQQIRAVEVRSDGMQVAAGGNNDDVYLFARGAEGTLSLEHEGGCHDGDVMDLSYHPDGHRLASGGGAPFRVGAFPLACTMATAAPYAVRSAEFEDAFDVESVAYDANGRRIAVALDRELLVLDATDLSAIAGIDMHFHIGEASLGRVRWLDDDTLVTWSGGTLYIASVSREAAGELARLPAEALVRGFDLSPAHPSLAVVATDGLVRILDLVTLRFSATLDGHRNGAYAARHSPDGAQLATLGRTPSVVVWRLE